MQSLASLKQTPAVGRARSVSAPCSVKARHPVLCHAYGKHDKPGQVDPHELLNVDRDPLSTDPGDLGRVGEGVLDFELKEEPPRHKVMNYGQPGEQPKASAEAKAPAPQQAQQGHFDEPGYFKNPHHLANVDVNPMSTDPGDLGRVAEGVLKEWEGLSKES